MKDQIRSSTIFWLW